MSMKAERTEAKKAPMGNETGKTRMNGIYVLVQCTWGALQTLLGLAVFALHVKERHFRYHGAVVTQWKCRSSVSLGLFVFVTDRPYFAEKFKGEIPVSELAARLVVHEYGHTLQSLILGPLYLPVIGVSSTVWGFLPRLARRRRERGISYFAFFTERWANRLGELATKERSIGQLVID